MFLHGQFIAHVQNIHWKTCNNNIIYNLHFGFRQQYSTSHALINITENIRRALDDGNIDYRIFVDLQKALNTADHQILLAKLSRDGIRGNSIIGLNLVCLIVISMYP